MAVAISGGSEQGGKRRRGRRYRVMSEINVTPFVDVMLVLLIIFMVAAPLLTVGVPVDLPKTHARALQGDREPLAVSVTKEGVFLQDTKVSIEEIVPKMQAIAGTGYDQRIFIRADKGVPYGNVMEVMGLIAGAGFTRIGLVTDQAPQAPPPSPGR